MSTRREGTGTLKTEQQTFYKKAKEDEEIKKKKVEII